MRQLAPQRPRRKEAAHGTRTQLDHNAETSYEDPLDIPAIACGAMAGSKPFVAAARAPGAAWLPRRACRELAREGDPEAWRSRQEQPRAAGLSRQLRALRRLHRQVPLFHGHRRSQEHAGRAPEPDAQGLPPLFHAGRESYALAGGRRRPDARGARRVVQLFPPVLAVPALLGLLPLRHRHRRNLHGRPRDHGLHRHGAEILQRDHRQGPQGRQQSRPAAQGAEKHARRA